MTRQILSSFQGGGVVFTQELQPDGSWYNRSARAATEEELTRGEAMPSNELSGSHNAHARLAPSDAKRWTQCTAAVPFCQANSSRVLADKDSPWAAEGTEAHDWAAKVLSDRCGIEDVPADFRPHVGEYVDLCLDLLPDGMAPMVEVKVPLFYQPAESGTCDFAVVTDEKVVVRDYKHGAGVLVLSHENPQLAIYSLSLIRSLEEVYQFTPDTVMDMAVFQPRHHEGAMQEPWVVTLAELEAFCEDIKAKAQVVEQAIARLESVPTIPQSRDDLLAIAPMLEFAPSEGDQGACRWCGAKAFCEARLAAVTEALPAHDPREFITAMPMADKEQKKLPAKERLELRNRVFGTPMDDDFLVRVLRCADAMRTYLKDVEEYMQGRLDEGHHIPGLKLVMGREGNRAWANEEAADTWLRGQGLKKEERYDYKLKSPAKVETILKDALKASLRRRKSFMNLVERAPAKQVLALEEDKRKAVRASVKAMPMAGEEPFEV